MARNPRSARWPSLLGLALAACLAMHGQARADGDNPKTPTCPPGQIYDSKAMHCVPQQAGILPDRDLTQYAFALATAGRYREALAVLNLLRDPNNAVALNYRGFVTRKLGRVDEGIGYYLRSVALDPNYAQVREYLGEAYVLKRDLARANAQLAAIKTICGTRCEAYEHLAAAIEQGPDACGSRYAAKRCASQG